MSNPKLPPKEQALKYLRAAKSYAPVALAVFLIAIYGFLLWRINGLVSSTADPTAVSSQLQTVGVPHVDKQVVKKMQSLQNNNVDVNSLFKSARDNPFSE